MTAAEQKGYEDFLAVTGYDIKAFFQRFVDFVNTKYSYIIDYYNGGIIEKDAFFELDALVKEIEKIQPLFTIHSNTLSTISQWGILDTFTEIQTKILTIKMSAKWMRSVYTSVRSNTIKVNNMLKGGQDFEGVAAGLESLNPQDDWMNITIPQYIDEEDYTAEGDTPVFTVNLKNIGINYVDSVVDPLDGKSVLGKDISADFVFEDGDLKTVMYEDAMRQALDIIMKSLKGCIPEFAEYGIPNEFIGTNVNTFQYAVIFKAIMNMFQRDSRWKKVELIDLKYVEGSVFIQIKATAVTENDYIINVPI